MKRLEHRSLQCIYCDDVREELGGKTTIVGWYPTNDVLLPTEGGLLLPALCVLANIFTPLDQPFKSMKVELMQDDQVLQTIEPPEQALLEMQEQAKQSPGPLEALQIRVAIKLVNWHTDHPCRVHLRATLDDEVLYGNGMRFARQAMDRPPQPLADAQHG